MTDLSQSNAYDEGEAFVNVPLPNCPRCGATGNRCKRPSGHDAAQWHSEREDLYAQACGCPVCVAWLERRGCAGPIGEQLLLEVGS